MQGLPTFAAPTAQAQGCSLKGSPEVGDTPRGDVGSPSEQQSYMCRFPGSQEEGSLIAWWIEQNTWVLISRLFHKAEADSGGCCPPTSSLEGTTAMGWGGHHFMVA